MKFQKFEVLRMAQFYIFGRTRGPDTLYSLYILYK